MRIRLAIVVFMMALGGAAALGDGEKPAPAAQLPADAPHQLQLAYADVAAQVNQSIVCVTSYVRIANPSPPDPSNKWQSASQQVSTDTRRLASASGIVMDDAGTILTCRHSLVTADNKFADLVDVEVPDGQHFFARIVGSEPTLNLAVLQLEVFEDGPKPAIKAARVGTLDQIKPGFTAIAVADPFGSIRTFAPGFIAALPSQECYQADLTSTFIQATMTVHPESYGGALASLDSEVIAILMPPVSASGDVQVQGVPGVTFGLPISTALTVGNAIRETQTHESPWLGFAVLSMKELRAKLNDSHAFDEMKKPVFGIYVQDVFTPSPASAADIRVGDFLLSIDGQRIATVAAFQRRLYLSQVGHAAALEIFRDGEVLKKNVTVEKRSQKANERW